MLCHTSFSQKHQSAIEDDSKLEYLFDLHGQKRTINITTRMEGDSMRMGWELRSQKGCYLILPQALMSGDKLSFKQGIPNQTIILKPDETFCMISRYALQQLKNTHQFIYNNTTYILNNNETENIIIRDGKTLEVFHVTALVDPTEMWIMDNDKFPLIIQIRKNPLGINFSLISIFSINNDSGQFPK